MPRRTALVLGLALAACAAPADVFDRAQRALAADDLPAALVAFDAVPVSHARYPEARAAALSVERRMRRGHELVLEGMLLRSEWRDDEALAVLERAHEVWPAMPGTEALVVATRHRQQMLAATAPAEPTRAATAAPDDVAHQALVPVPVPIEVPVPTATDDLPAAPLAETAKPAAVETEAPEADAAISPLEPNSPIVIGLVAVEARLGRGELEGALADLLELAKHYPDDIRVRFRLARVLHQRALQRYAQGQLAAAISDWERVAAMDPRDQLAQSLLDAARAEARAATPAR